MSSPAFDDSAREFLSSHITSVAQLLLLFHMMKEPRRRWSAVALALELRVSEVWVAGQLQGFVHSALAVRDGEFFSYAEDDALHRVVQCVQDAYQRSPDAVVTCIYGGTDRTLKSFSDAFRLRKSPQLPATPPASSIPPPRAGEAHGGDLPHA